MTATTPATPSIAAPRIAVALAVASATLAWLELFAPIFEGKAAAADPYALPYYLPAIAIVTVAGIFALRPALRAHSSVLLLLTGTWLLVSKVDNVKAWWWLDTAHVGVAAMLITSGVILANAADVGLGATPRIWPVLAAIGGALWVIGEWLPWLNFQADNGPRREVVASCCQAYSGGDAVGYLFEAGLMALILVGAVLVAIIRQASVAGVGLMGLAVLYLDASTSWLVDLTHPDLTRKELVESYGIETAAETVTTTPALGGWLALAALVILFALGIARIQARAGVTSLTE